jgi:hypothetical protein
MQTIIRYIATLTIAFGSLSVGVSAQNICTDAASLCPAGFTCAEQGPSSILCSPPEQPHECSSAGCADPQIPGCTSAEILVQTLKDPCCGTRSYACKPRPEPPASQPSSETPENGGDPCSAIGCTMKGAECTFTWTVVQCVVPGLNCTMSATMGANNCTVPVEPTPVMCPENKVRMLRTEQSCCGEQLSYHCL